MLIDDLADFSKRLLVVDDRHLIDLLAITGFLVTL
jgi:hypothetical protein